MAVWYEMCEQAKRKWSCDPWPILSYPGRYGFCDHRITPVSNHPQRLPLHIPGEMVGEILAKYGTVCPFWLIDSHTNLNGDIMHQFAIQPLPLKNDKMGYGHSQSMTGTGKWWCIFFVSLEPKHWVVCTQHLTITCQCYIYAFWGIC